MVSLGRGVRGVQLPGWAYDLGQELGGEVDCSEQERHRYQGLRRKLWRCECDRLDLL